MNNGHLPAGRGAHGGPGMANMQGERHGGAPGHVGGGGGRGGGRRNRNYNNGNNYHYHNNYNPNGHQAQYQQQMYQGYMNGFPGPQYNYPPMHYMQNQAMANGYVPYQQSYGRGSGVANLPQYAQMGPAPVAMHAAPHQPPQQQQYQQHVPPLPLPQPQLPQPLPHLQPPHTSPYSRNDQRVAPLVVTTPQPQQLPPPPFPVHGHIPQQSPPVGFSSFHPPPPVPAGLPLSLPPHIPPPPRGDLPLGSTHTPVPYPVTIPTENPSITPSSTGSTNAITTPMSVASIQQKEQVATPNYANPPAAGPELGSSPDTTTAATPAIEPYYEADSFGSAEISAVPQEAEPAESSLSTRDVQVTLPWLSDPTSPFPPRRKAPRNKRRGLQDVTNVDMPQISAESVPSEPAALPQTPRATEASMTTSAVPKASVISPTPTTGQASRTAVPVVPVLPIRPAANKPPTGSPATAAKTPIPATESVKADSDVAKSAEATVATPDEGVASQEGKVEAENQTPAAPAAPLPPKLWTGLFSKTAASTAASQTGPNSGAVANGHATNGVNGSGAFSRVNASSLAEAISSYRVGNSSKLSFIEPRGLINTGNMCYMNSVLQVLTFCTPFYDFLDQVGQKAVFSFKSQTPMIDAMISFLREFKVIDRADPIDLQRRLKSDDLERYGEPFTPEFVYNAINELPRFSSMIRGHQQDAEEFLGFLLESLNDECTRVVNAATGASNPSSSPTSAHATPAASVTSETPDVSGDGWLEVGPRQRSAVTRSSGNVSASPVNSIFGGLLRSELRVPGRQMSITMEPYQALQLHIDSPEVRNVVDALRNLTVPEGVHAKFDSPNGSEVTANKQTFMEHLPPILIMHLKRFQFDWKVNGTVKIWKKVGYPLELEIPRELFSRRKRNAFLSEPLPKYRLNAVVYHHGKQASGGHYTVDVLRADGSEWIRLDDTNIRRIRKEDVAEAGAEEAIPNKADARYSATNGKRDDSSTTGGANRFAGMGDEDSGENGAGWSTPVNGNGKKWSSVANGTASPTAAASKAKQTKDNIKDNKVAYLLFYQRVN